MMRRVISKPFWPFPEPKSRFANVTLGSIVELTPETSVALAMDADGREVNLFLLLSLTPSLRWLISLSPFHFPSIPLPICGN